MKLHVMHEGTDDGRSTTFVMLLQSVICAYIHMHACICIAYNINSISIDEFQNALHCGIVHRMHPYCFHIILAKQRSFIHRPQMVGTPTVCAAETESADSPAVPAKNTPCINYEHDETHAHRRFAKSCTSILMLIAIVNSH